MQTERSPSKTLYEDGDFRVILDLGPATRGHALILPREHADNLYELPEDTAAKVFFVLAKKMATKMTEKLHCDGLNIVQNNGEGCRTDRSPFSYAFDSPL